MKKFLQIAAVVGTGLILAGCAGSPTFLDPGSSISTDEANLYWILIYLSIVVFLIVEVWLVYNIIRFRKRKQSDEIPKQIYGNMRLEIFWTFVPLLLTAVLFGLTIRTANAVSAPAPSAQDLNVNVVGHQWWWEFDYPDLGVVTANELHVPVNKVVQIQLRSMDVIHSFWVPQLSGKTDVIPGQVNHIWFQANNIGDYHGQCAEFCGLNHANMRIKVVVESQADFDAWVKNQQLPPPQPQGPAEQDAYKMITAGICSNCHMLGDQGPENPSGPNLNHLFSRSVFAGATYDLTEDNIRRWLTENQQMKPGNDMSVNLKPGDVDSIMAYLTRLK